MQYLSSKLHGPRTVTQSYRPKDKRWFSGITEDTKSKMFAVEVCAKTNKKRTFWKDETTNQLRVVEEQLPLSNSNSFRSTAYSFVKSCFLPEGYPNSEYPHSDIWYKMYLHGYICGSASYVLSTKALLSSVGVGLAISLPGSAAISWVLKDGLGCLGMMAVASKLGTRFDSDTKRNKWRADVLHNLGVGLELATPLMPSNFLLLASLANVAKGLAGITSGATRASLNKHFSLSENLGDITAKAQTQGIATYLAGMSLGIGLSLIPYNTPGSISVFATFSMLALVHIYASYQAVSAVALQTLNLQRLSLLLDKFFVSNVVATPDDIRTVERIILQPDYLAHEPQILFSPTISEAVGNSLECLHSSLEHFKDEKYFVCIRDSKIHVVLHEASSPTDILKAYFTAYYIRQQLSSKSETHQPLSPAGSDDTLLLVASTQFTRNHFTSFLEQVNAKHWVYSSAFLMLPYHHTSSAYSAVINKSSW